MCATDHARPALRQRRVRRHPLLRDRRRCRGGVPPARTPGTHAQGSRTTRHRVRRRRGDAGDPRRPVRESPSRRLRASARVVRHRLDRPGRRAGEQAPDGRDVPDRRAPGGRPGEARRVVVAAQSGDLAAAAEAVRGLRQLDPREGRGEGARLRRSAVRRCAGTGRRMHRRERVHGQARATSSRSNTPTHCPGSRATR